MRKTILYGLGFGSTAVAVAAGAFFWKSEDHWLKIENNQDRTLSVQFETAPSMILPPRSVESAAKVLGFTDSQKAIDEAQVFADRVTGGFLPSGWKEKCPTTYSSELCGALDDYFAPVMSTPRVRSGRRGRRVFAVSKVVQLQGDDYSEMRGTAPNWSLKQIRAFAKEALKTKACPRNFSFVLARSLEELLPDNEVWPLMDQLDAQAFECLEPSHPDAEVIGLKVGLLRYARGEALKALPFLDKAELAENKREEYRVLYWKSRILSDLGRTQEADSYAQKLRSHYPLSWYTIQNEVRLHKDPLLFFQTNRSYPDLYDSGDAILDKRMAWLHLLIALPEAGYAVRRFGEYVVKAAKSETNPAVLQYLARLFSRAGFHRLQIILVNQVGQVHPEYLTVESLKLLFPKPFFDEIDKHSPGVDIALILGLARQESGFDPLARSKVNATGLLQVLPSTARGIKKADESALYDYAHNIEVGSKYLLGLIKRFDGSVERSLSAYNAGPTNVRKWEKRYGFVTDAQLFNDLVPFCETRDYVPSILRNAYWYHRLFPKLSLPVLKDEAVSSSTLKALLVAQPFDRDKK